MPLMDNFEEIIKRFFSRSYSESDLKKLFLWFNSEKGIEEISEEFHRRWKTIDYDKNIMVDSVKLGEIIKKKVGKDKFYRLRRIIKRFFPYAAVLFIAFVFVSLVILRYHTDNQSIKPVVSTKDTTVISENGQHSTVVLPDSSIVWLYSGATLSYDNKFSGINSHIILKGQASYKIIYYENIPVVFRRNSIFITAPWTKYDIDAYPGSGGISVVPDLGIVKLTHDGIDNECYKILSGEGTKNAVGSQRINVFGFRLSNNTPLYKGKSVKENIPMHAVINLHQKWFSIDSRETNAEVYSSIPLRATLTKTCQKILNFVEYYCPVTGTIMNNLKSIPKIIIRKE